MTTRSNTGILGKSIHYIGDWAAKYPGYFLGFTLGGLALIFTAIIAFSLVIGPEVVGEALRPALQESVAEPIGASSDRVVAAVERLEVSVSRLDARLLSFEERLETVEDALNNNQRAGGDE